MKLGRRNFLKLLGGLPFAGLAGKTAAARACSQAASASIPSTSSPSVDPSPGPPINPLAIKCSNMPRDDSDFWMASDAYIDTKGYDWLKIQYILEDQSVACINMEVGEHRRHVGFNLGTGPVISRLSRADGECKVITYN
jgi:hypothetical protein